MQLSPASPVAATCKPPDEHIHRINLQTSTLYTELSIAYRQYDIHHHDSIDNGPARFGGQGDVAAQLEASRKVHLRTFGLACIPYGPVPSPIKSASAPGSPGRGSRMHVGPILCDARIGTHQLHCTAWPQILHLPLAGRWHRDGIAATPWPCARLIAIARLRPKAQPSRPQGWRRPTVTRCQSLPASI